MGEVQVNSAEVDRSGRLIVACSDGRTPDPDTRKVPPVGNMVDVANASYTNDIGDSQLAAV